MDDGNTVEGSEAMINNAEPATMTDPELLAERKQVRESLLALSDRYEVLTAVFDRRAAAQWAQPSQSSQ